MTTDKQTHELTKHDLERGTWKVNVTGDAEWLEKLTTALMGLAQVKGFQVHVDKDVDLGSAGFFVRRIRRRRTLSLTCQRHQEPGIRRWLQHMIDYSNGAI